MSSVVKEGTAWKVRLPVPDPWGWPEGLWVDKVMPDMGIALCFPLPNEPRERVQVPVEVIQTYYRKHGARPGPGELTEAQISMLFALTEGSWRPCGGSFALNTARALRRRLLVVVDDRGPARGKTRSRVRITKEGERKARYLKGEENV